MKKHHLTFKFTLMFFSFTLITLFLTSILSYYNQSQLYQKQREESIQYVASYLEKLVLSGGEDFINMQKYTLSHFSSLKIPVNYDESDIKQSRADYEALFAQNYSGKVLGKDIQFEELSEEVKTAHAIYYYEYFRFMFEQATESFNLAFSYYLVPTGEKEHMYWFLDAMREPETEGSPYLNISIDVLDPISEGHNCMWEAWETGKRPSGFDTYDNEYGKTYAYYTPVFINGEKTGVIGVEVEIAKVNHEILFATIRQMLMIAGVLVMLVLMLLLAIHHNYIRRLIKIQNVIDEYSQSKDSELAEKLQEEITNEDEISGIMEKLSDMIYELELYMYNLDKTKKDLKNTRQQAIELNELALKDSLTGIRNKTGYDKEVQKIKWEMAEDLKEVGVAMIDLNFLKRINDTYGHDKGNISIINLSRIVCHVFDHSPVFRIGGDEFVVILKDNDLKYIEELVSEFKRQLNELQKDESLEYWEKISAAIGYAIYNPKIDSSYENIFKRADAEMYRCKKAMKAARED